MSGSVGEHFLTAMGAIVDLFSDERIGIKDTIKKLQTLKNEIEIMIEALEGEIEEVEIER